MDESVAGENRRRLLELSATPPFLRAELHRELGEFDEAAEALSKVPEDDGWAAAKGLLQQAIENRKTKVFELILEDGDEW